MSPKSNNLLDSQSCGVVSITRFSVLHGQTLLQGIGNQFSLSSSSVYSLTS